MAAKNASKSIRQTVALDDGFSREMKKLQTSIEKVGMLVDDFRDIPVKPAGSQVMQLKHAYEDIKALHDKMKGLQ